MLVNVLLVTTSSRGHHLVFRYPVCPGGLKDALGTNEKNVIPLVENTSLNIRSRSLYYVKDLQQTAQVQIVCNSGGVKSDAAPSNVDWLYGNALGYNSQLLANILSPKAALCNSKFQLTVDSLTFVGHPILLTSEERNAAIQEGASSELLSQQPPSIHMFHLVFVIRTTSHTQKYVESLHRSTIMKVSLGLKYEEIRCQYVRKQADVINQILDDISNGKIVGQS
jgi:hypothetical protein